MKTKIISILTSKATLAVFLSSVFFISGIALAKVDLMQLESEFRETGAQYKAAQELLDKNRLNHCLATKALANAKELAHINGEAVLSPEDLERVQSKTKWSCF